jgi:hypothetical protein
MSIFSRKFLLSAILVFLAAILATIALAAFAYWRGISKDTPVEKFSEVVLDGQKRLGDDIEVYALFKTPWHRFPQEASLVPGKGSQLIDKPQIELYKIRYGFCIWKVRADIQAYRTGDIPKGTLDVVFNEGKSEDAVKHISLEIPSFNVSSLDVGASRDLALASSIDKNKNGSNALFMWLGIAGVLFILIIVLIVLCGKKKGPGRIVLTPWGIAFVELSELREQLKNGKLASPICFSRLTDIVRNYLEKRFSLRAPQQTTYEFLQDLRRSSGPLNENHRHFLKDFLTSADLVKFANLPADLTLLEDAMDKAEKLVSETKPEEDERK